MVPRPRTVAVVVPGELLGSGRTADVYAVDGVRVLRRVRPGIDIEAEAAALTYVVEHGYPAPRVLAVDGRDMILERVHGPTMLAALVSGDLAPEEAAVTLADLLRRLHHLPPRPPARDGTRLLHLDLHPDNVVLGPAGPRVIDWTNARDGPPVLDVAVSAVIIAQAAADDELPARHLAHRLLVAFCDQGLDLVAGLPEAARLRGANPTMSPREVELIPDAVGLIGSLVR